MIRSREAAPVLIAVGLVAGACSGGGGGSEVETTVPSTEAPITTDEVTTTLAAPDTSEVEIVTTTTESVEVVTTDEVVTTEVVAPETTIDPRYTTTTVEAVDAPDVDLESIITQVVTVCDFGYEDETAELGDVGLSARTEDGFSVRARIPFDVMSGFVGEFVAVDIEAEDRSMLDAVMDANSSTFTLEIAGTPADLDPATDPEGLEDWYRSDENIVDGTQNVRVATVVGMELSDDRISPTCAEELSS